MNHLKPVVLFLAVMSFLLLTAPANQCEAEDAYAYARLAERGAWSELFHAHHLLYLPLMRGLVSAADFFGYEGRALPLLIGFSMVSAALTVVLFFLLSGRSRSGLFFSLALLFSYGFWRYSTTAEIYIPVSMLSLVAWFCARRSDDAPLFFWCSAAAGAAALLLHVVSWPLVLAALPFYLSITQRTRQAVLYLVFVLTVVAVVYVCAMSGPGLTIYSDTQAVRETLMNPRAWVKGAIAWGQNVGSANFLFAIGPIAGKIQAFFPYHMLQEELFMGEAAPGWIRFVAPVSFIAAVLGMMTVVVVALRNVRDALKRDWQWLSAVLIWFGGVSITALVFEPANPEMWIASLVPFWLLLQMLWNMDKRDAASGRAFPAALAGLLLAHNALGGIGVVKSPESDYARKKAAWIVREATADDAVLIAESHSVVSFLRYESPAQITDAKFLTPAVWSRLVKETSGRIFVFDDVVHLLPPVARRAPEAVRQVTRTVELFKTGLVPVHVDQFGKVYQWTGK